MGKKNSFAFNEMEHDAQSWLCASKIAVLWVLCAVVSDITQGLSPAAEKKLFQNNPEAVAVPEITVPE